jgi:hypothetical protein
VLGPSTGGHKDFCAEAEEARAGGNNAEAAAAFIISLREKPDFIGQSSGCNLNVTFARWEWYTDWTDDDRSTRINPYFSKCWMSGA